MSIINIDTIRPRSLDSIHIVTYYTKSVKTFWTYSIFQIYLENTNIKLASNLFRCINIILL